MPEDGVTSVLRLQCGMQKFTIDIFIRHMALLCVELLLSCRELFLVEIKTPQCGIQNFLVKVSIMENMIR